MEAVEAVEEGGHERIFSGGCLVLQHQVKHRDQNQMMPQPQIGAEAYLGLDAMMA